jgi:SAM-dependent methyltransferase
LSALYGFLYRVGATPWESMPELAAGAQASAMLDREQAGREPPYGKALDLGCGTGIWSLELAKRGWEVVGIDSNARAVSHARERSRQTGVEARFIEGDAAALRASGVGDGFQLVLDFGAVHGLSPAQRGALGRELNEVTTDDAILLMYATAPGRRGPLPNGMSRADVEETYPGWEVTDEANFELAGLPGSFKRARPRWYRLAASAASSGSG